MRPERWTARASGKHACTPKVVINSNNRVDDDIFKIDHPIKPTSVSFIRLPWLDGAPRLRKKRLMTTATHIEKPDWPLLAGMAGTGIAVQIAAYWPGIMIWDAIRQYGQAVSGR